MIVGDMKDKNIDVKFVKLDDKEFIDLKFDVSNIKTIEELIEQIQSLDLILSKLYKITLVGNRNFEINTYKLYKLIDIRNIIKVKDMTTIGYDLEKLSNEVSLKGIYVKEILDRLNKEDLSSLEKEKIEKALEVGLDALS